MDTKLPINTHIDKENGDEPSSKEVEDTDKFLSMDSNKILDWHRLNFPDFDWRISPRTAALQKKKGKYWGNICFFGCGKHAAYPDEEGNLKRLCSNHAKMVGCHKVRNPCRDCPDDKKLEAAYPDEEGKSNRLCSEHAKMVGSHKVQHPCRDCPDDEKLQAHYPDEEGKSNRLCSKHAKLVGCHKVLNPCRDCPDDEKLEAHYPDEEGKSNRLCSECAKLVGSHKVQRPCRDCPDDEKLQANYPDEEGKSSQLCSECAIKAGTHIRSIHGSSIAACEFFDMYKQLTGIDLPHIHYALDQDHPEGQEIKGLVPGRKLRPDSYDKESQTVWLFHGEWYHGFPEWHPKHKSLVSHGRSSVDQWHKTVMDMQAYVDTGYNVKYILHEDYAKTRLVNNPTTLLSCIRDFLVEGVP